jgi:purine-cytosine permease-like protein
MPRPVAITAVPVSAEVDRHRRFVTYTVMMGVRVVCVLSMLFVSGWWQLLCVLGAVILPYVAVVIANVQFSQQRDVPERPQRALTARDE